MNVRPSILCPIDFSDGSAGALRHAAAIASHFATRLILLTVEDPLLTEAADLGTGIRWDPEECKQEMATSRPRRSARLAPAGDARIRRRGRQAGTGDSAGRARALLRSHRHQHARAHRDPQAVLRLDHRARAPGNDPSGADHAGSRSRSDFARRCEAACAAIVVPVDLSPASRHQAAVAAGLAEAAGVPLILVHVIEPVKTRSPPGFISRASKPSGARSPKMTFRPSCQLPPALHAEALVAYGDPAEELAKVAQDRGAGLVVMGLHGSPVTGPRMGSVTYRMLCLVHTLVLALPPERMEKLGARARAPWRRSHDVSGRVRWFAVGAARDVPAGARGTPTSATVPPPRRSLSAIVPLRSSTNRFTIARPRPVPPARVVKNGSNIRSWTSAGIPGPGPPSRSGRRPIAPPHDLDAFDCPPPGRRSS